MKGFLISILMFSLILFLIFCIGLIIPSKSIKENFHYSIYEKHQLLKEKTEKPRIILVGGSNVSFGIYSPIIEKEFDAKVINTAIHAGYGLKYCLDDVLPFLQQNDIVIVIPEYGQYMKNAFYGTQPLLEIINIYPENIKLLSAYQIWRVIQHIPKHALIKIKAFLSSYIKDANKIDAYHRKSFNEFGDAIKHWELKKKKPPVVPVKGKYNEAALDYISKFSKQVTDLGGHCYISFPCLNRKSFKQSETVISEIYNQIKAEKISILGTPERYSFEDSLHFDTHYHLIKEGQIQRTQYLIQDLKEHGLKNLLARIR